MKPSGNAADKEGKIPLEALIKSARFAGYQQDFMRALLPGEAYTPKEAEDILLGYFKAPKNTTQK